MNFIKLVDKSAVTEMKIKGTPRVEGTTVTSIDEEWKGEMMNWLEDTQP